MDELYVLARRILLDALEALGPHREAVVLVGAQAIYLRVGEADLAVAPYTTDGDLVIEPGKLKKEPPIERVLAAAGFHPQSKDSVGIWIAHSPAGGRRIPVAVDLLVPASLSPGKGRRAAKLPGHDPKAARIVKGLEGALIDFDRLVVEALEPSDLRRFEIRVAGPAALLVSKLHKIADRQHGSRLHDKDALDAFRLLRVINAGELAARMKLLLVDQTSAAAAKEGLNFLRELFSRKTGEGVLMVVRATVGLANGAEMALACEILSNDFLKAISRGKKP